MSYRVLADDNFHVEDDNFRHTLGEFPSYAEALAACEEVVERFLRHEYVPGMAESALFFRYMMFGRARSSRSARNPRTPRPGFPPGTTPSCAAARSVAPRPGRLATNSG